MLLTGFQNYPSRRARPICCSSSASRSPGAGEQRDGLPHLCRSARSATPSQPPAFTQRLAEERPRRNARPEADRTSIAAALFAPLAELTAPRPRGLGRARQPGADAARPALGAASRRAAALHRLFRRSRPAARSRGRSRVRRRARPTRLGFPARALRWEGEKPADRHPGGGAQGALRADGRGDGADGAEVLLTAHHLGDQAETVLMRLAHGSGIEGLRGMDYFAEVGGAQRSSGPLLGVDPDELRARGRRGRARRRSPIPPIPIPHYERVRWRADACRSSPRWASTPGASASSPSACATPTGRSRTWPSQRLCAMVAMLGPRRRIADRARAAAERCRAPSPSASSAARSTGRRRPEAACAGRGRGADRPADPRAARGRRCTAASSAATARPSASPPSRSRAPARRRAEASPQRDRALTGNAKISGLSPPAHPVLALVTP